MSDDRLTPEERAVIEAALSWDDASSITLNTAEGALEHAVAAYRKATAPPEPFDGWVTVFPDGSWHVDMEDDGRDPGYGGVRYRCTVTPVERVR